MRETWVWSLGWEDPLEKGKATQLQYSGLANSMDYIVHGVTKSQTRLSDFHFHLLLIWASQVALLVKNPPTNAGRTRDMGSILAWVRKIPLEEGMATHSSSLAWRIPWTKEPGGLHSIVLTELDTTEAT